MKTLALWLAMIPTNALAFTHHAPDNSGLFVWIFLGFCAAIIVAQLVPAILMFVGMMKGMFGKEIVSKN